jgi:hypothetical protein
MAFGGTKRAVAKAFGLSEASIWRHWNKHTPQPIKDAMRISVLKPGATLESLIEEEGVDLVETLKIARASILWSLDQAVQLEDRHGVSMMTAALHRNVELVGRFTGELINRSQHVSVSLVLSEEYLKLRGDLLRILQLFPDAAAAVAAAFRNVECAGPSRGAPTPTMIAASAKEVHVART